MSQWADRERVLPETAAARGSRWCTADVPYLRGFMDAVHEPGVRKIALMKAAQVAGSEGLHNILGYFMAYDPYPMLFVHPSAEVAQEWSKERLADMIRSTPALSLVVQGERRRTVATDSESTLALKLFPGGYLAIGGANTPNTFARRGVRVAFGDDVDRFPAVVGEEGDPLDLLAKRTTTFEDYDPLVLLVSTPTLKGGRIDTEYQRSDRRRFVVTCPSCGREDWITWLGKCDDETCGRVHMHVVFTDRDPSTARLVCPGGEHGGCGVLFDEAERRKMISVAGARPDHGWRPTAESQEDGLIGIHLPAMISTLGVTLSKMVNEWLSARAKGTESLRVFVNTTLAEAWEERGTRPNPHRLSARREDYGEDVEVPAFVGALTAGVDVQKDYFALQVWGWGPANEAAVIDWRFIPGDPTRPEEWEALATALTRTYRHALGVDLPIHATCIDSGFESDQTYNFVLRHQYRRVYATKGVAGRSGEPIVVSGSEKRRGQRARPVKLWLVNVDDAKADIMGRFEVVTPGPGYLHFPLGVDRIDDEYFAQLCSEVRNPKKNKSGVATHVVYEQIRDRNEGLDTAVGCLGAWKMLAQDPRQMHAQIVAAAAAMKPPKGGAGAPPASTPPATPRPPAGRRVARSGYLGR